MDVKFWGNGKAEFVVGNKDGKVVLTCLNDGTQHTFETEEEARQFALEYEPHKQN